MLDPTGIAHTTGRDNDLRAVIKVDGFGFFTGDGKFQSWNVIGLIPLLTSSIASSSKQSLWCSLNIVVAPTASGLSTNTGNHRVPVSYDLP